MVSIGCRSKTFHPTPGNCRIDETFIPIRMQVEAMALHVRRKLTKWGNGWGLRLTKKEVAALGLKPGQPVEADFGPKALRNPIEDLPSWNLGGNYDIDEEIDADLMEKYDRGRR